MMAPDQPVNPYAAPRVLDRALERDAEQRLGDYAPQWGPRSLQDLAKGMAIGIPMGLSVYVVPIAIVFLFGLPTWLIPVLVLFVFLVAIIAIMSGIRKVTLTADGITAWRTLFPRTVLNWQDVVEVRELTWSEAYYNAMVKSYRCCAGSVTYEKHMLIRTAQSWIAFTPKEVAEFRATVNALVVREAE